MLKLSSRFNNEAIIYYGKHIYDTSVLRKREFDAIKGSVLKRCKEYSTCRYFIHQAFENFGIKDIAIPKSKDGNPLWPNGFTGSISHCDHLGVVIVLKSDGSTFAGIDIECNKSIPKTVIELILNKKEIKKCKELYLVNPNINWQTLIFSVKETAYKYWHNKVKYKLKASECEVTLIPEESLFHVKTLVLSNIHEIIGEYFLVDNHFITLVIN